MKIKTTLLVITLAASSLVFAGSERKAPRADRSDRIAEKLNLTEAQQEQFKIVMQSKHERMKAAMEVIHEEIINELSTFLSDDQMQKVKEHQEQRQDLRQHVREHKKMRHFAPKH